MRIRHIPFIIILIIASQLHLSGQSTTEVITPVTEDKASQEKVAVFLQLADESKTVNLEQAIS